MKKIFTLVVLLSAMTLTTQAQGVSFGVKGGIDVTDMSFSEKVFDTSNRLGWFIGPSLQIDLPVPGLGVDIAGLYDQKSTEVNDQTIKMNLRFKIGFGSDAGIYLALGPQFGFNVGDDEFKWNQDGVENTFQLKKSSLSANFGAGFYISRCWEVGVTYNIALGDTGDATFKSTVEGIKDGGKSKTWQLSAAYYF